MKGGGAFLDEPRKRQKMQEEMPGKRGGGRRDSLAEKQGQAEANWKRPEWAAAEGVGLGGGRMTKGQCC